MTSARILFFSDTHLRDFGSFPPFNKVQENGFTRELNNILAGFDFVVDRILEVLPAAVILPGDIFHSPEALTTTTIAAAARAFRSIKDACNDVGARFIIMPGNHDCYSEALGIYSTSVLEGYGEMVTTDKVLKIQTGDKTWLRVGIVQFATDEERTIVQLKTMAKKCDIIVTHADFQGCAYENGWRSESIIPTNFPIPIISGDIHCAQQIGSVYYIGSLVQNRFTCRNLDQVGGVLVYDSSDQSFERFPNTASTHYLKIDEPEDLQVLINTPFNAALQIKCELTPEEFTGLVGDREYVYIPMKKRAKAEVGSQPGMKLNFGSPFSMLKRFVAESRPEAVEFLASTLPEEASDG